MTLIRLGDSDVSSKYRMTKPQQTMSETEVPPVSAEILRDDCTLPRIQLLKPF